MTDLSIIIISYNTKEITKKCLQTAVTSLKYNPQIKTEIIVIDNNSTDSSKLMLKEIQNSKSILEAKNIKFKIIFNKKNLGYAKANNLGVKESQGKYLLFLNSDIEAIDDAIPSLFNFYKQKEKVFNFLGGKLLNKNLTSQPSCGPFYTLPVIAGALFLRGDYWGLTRQSPKTIKKVDWVSGACFITGRKYFNKVGGFDENIFMYMDEIDFFYRAKKMGLTVGFYPKAKFIHLGSASSKGRSEPILQVYRGFLYLYRKHFPSFKLEILKSMLKLKALASIFLGKVLKNEYLVKTYGQALEIIKNYR